MQVKFKEDYNKERSVLTEREFETLLTYTTGHHFQLFLDEMTTTQLSSLFFSQPNFQTSRVPDLRDKPGGRGRGASSNRWFTPNPHYIENGRSSKGKGKGR